jgi:hypothetical protein
MSRDVVRRLRELGYVMLTIAVPQADGQPVRLHATRGKRAGGGSYQTTGADLASALATLLWPQTARKRLPPIGLDDD